MPRNLWRCTVAAAALLLCLGAARAQDVIISEFLAANSSVLQDEDGDYSDWIELYNPGTNPVKLQGWFLTDSQTNKTKWRIPNVTLGPKAFLVIFASNKNRTNPSKTLHTNFALSASGEYLGLIKPDGRTVAHEYAPAFPPQQSDVSYGVVFEGSATTLLPSGAPAFAHVPEDDALGTAWIDLEFDHSGWQTGTTGIGYERSTGYESLIGLDLNGAMYGVNTSAYIRVPFTVSDLSSVERLTLRMKYDDGFVAYLNGVPVASANAPATLGYASSAPTNNPDEQAVVFDDFDITAHRNALEPGANLLAIHGLNDLTESADFLILPELVGFAGQGVLPNMVRSFTVPTPGAPNGITTDLGPIISEVSHAPNAPIAGESLTVRARVAVGHAAVGPVTLTYRVMFGPEITIPMYDDGAHDDGAAGDGIYAATIPAGAYAAGQMVRYFIRATDTASYASRYPVFKNAARDAEYMGTMVADPAVVTPLPVLYWFVQDPVAAETRDGARASAFYNGRLYDNIFVRERGYSSVLWPKKSLKFDFNSGDHFSYAPNQDPVEEFNLQSTYSDKTYMRQVLAWETYAAAGVDGPRSFHMRVQRNGAFYSVAEWVEQPDSRMLTRMGWDPDGALYKADNSTLDSAEGFDKKLRKHEDNSDLQALVAGLALNGNALAEYLFDNLDIPAVINYIATTSIIHDIDATAKNYYLYRDSDGSGEWKVLPWDKDLTFGRNYTPDGGVLNDTIWAAHDPESHPLTGTGNRLLYAILTGNATTQQMYARRYRTLMENLLQPPGTPYAERRLENRIDQLESLIASDVAIDRVAWPVYGVPQSLGAAVSIMKTEFLEPRRYHLFVTHGGPGQLIPPALTGVAPIQIAAIERATTTGNTEEQYIRLDNPTADYVDISGWSLLGEARHTFRPGTVIPANGSIYVAKNPRAFRGRDTAPKGGSGLFVQGNFKGTLDATPKPLQLRTNTGQMVALTGYGMADAMSALRISAGLAAADEAETALLDIVSDGDSASVVDMADALRLLQLAGSATP